MSLQYCEALRDHLVKALGKSASIEVYHHHHTLIISVVAGAVASVRVPLV